MYLSLDQLQNVAQDCSPGPFPSCAAGEGFLRASFTPVFDGSHGFGITWRAAAQGPLVAVRRLGLHGTGGRSGRQLHRDEAHALCGRRGRARRRGTDRRAARGGREHAQAGRRLGVRRCSSESISTSFNAKFHASVTAGPYAGVQLELGHRRRSVAARSTSPSRRATRCRPTPTASSSRRSRSSRSSSSSTRRTRSAARASASSRSRRSSRAACRPGERSAGTTSARHRLGLPAHRRIGHAGRVREALPQRRGAEGPDALLGWCDPRAGRPPGERHRRRAAARTRRPARPSAASRSAASRRRPRTRRAAATGSGATSTSSRRARRRATPASFVSFAPLGRRPAGDRLQASRCRSRRRSGRSPRKGDRRVSRATLRATRGR